MDQYLTIIQYETSADQTFLVMNTEQIFNYYENPSAGVNAMISKITQDQYNQLISKGYLIQIVEKNPDMNTYVFFENDTPNQASNLAYLGKVYAISEFHTLVKLTNEEARKEVLSSDFKETPLLDIRPQLAEQNNVALNERSISMTVTPNISEPVATENNSNTLLTTVFIGVVIILGVVAYIAWKKFKKTPPQSINEPPTPQIN